MLSKAILKGFIQLNKATSRENEREVCQQSRGHHVCGIDLHELSAGAALMVSTTVKSKLDI